MEVINSNVNREKLADKIFESMEEDEIRLLAYKGLLKIYESNSIIFEHDWKQEFSDVIDLSV